MPAGLTGFASRPRRWAGLPGIRMSSRLRCRRGRGRRISSRSTLMAARSPMCWRVPGRRLPVKRAMRIAADVCAALEHAHRRGVVHRDLNPSNVWLSADGTAKLGDFGLVAALRQSASGTFARITGEGMMVGTIPYMAPEQALGRAPDLCGPLFVGRRALRARHRRSRRLPATTRWRSSRSICARPRCHPRGEIPRFPGRWTR